MQIRTKTQQYKKIKKSDKKLPSRQNLFIDYKRAIESVYVCNVHSFNEKILDKELLYNIVSNECDILSNPAIRILISGDDQVNKFLLIKDHKKYADAILMRCKSDWRKDFRFFKYSLKAQHQIRRKCLNEETVRILEKLVAEYYILPQEQIGIDDQIRAYIELPPMKYTEQTANVRTNRLSEYIDAAENIHMIWQGLSRQTDDTSQSTLIPMPNPYVVPGGRFREIYYWDSYFTILGLNCSGLNDYARGMVENFFYLVNQFGFIPNGNRSYYLSRSQPPFLAMMVEAVLPEDLSVQENRNWLKDAYDSVSLEYNNNWMDPKTHFVEEMGLNRYFDPIDKKRPECFGSDNNGMDIKKGFYSNERAECASGMDFTMRFEQRCSDFLPVDLNCLLYRYECLLSKWASMLDEKEQSIEWRQKAQHRKELIMKYMYNPQDGLFYDYDFANEKQSTFKSIATLYPMWVKMLDAELACQIRNAVVYDFEADGGVLTSAKPKTENLEIELKPTEEYQWDCPNGWAPMQLITIKALKNYGYKWDARRLSLKWLDLNTDMYKQTGKFYEKYNIIEKNIDVNTSYPQQYGFGWTNGVYLELLTKVLPAIS